MFKILAHGTKNSSGTFSYAQNQLIHSEAPIRICGAPTGAGKTFAFIELAKTQFVFFVVPTQALAQDIEKTAQQENVAVERWEFSKTLEWIEQSKEPWREKKGHLDMMAVKKGIIVATVEALGNLIMGKPMQKNVDTGIVDLLWKVDHLVFDEAHALNERAFGLVHFMLTLIAYRHQKSPEDAPKLSLLSATHSNLFSDFVKIGYVPADFVDSFDEKIDSDNYDRPIHGDVAVEFHDEGLVDVLVPSLVPQSEDKSLLLIYDSLAKFVEDEKSLATIFDGWGLKRNQVILINGQDKQTKLSWGSSGFDGGTIPLPRHKVIVGTSAVEMGVNYKVNTAVIEHGIDAAALLQRIGRVARGANVGVVHVCRSRIAGRRKLSFVEKLSSLSGDYTITALRETLQPLRQFNMQTARELGSAYWSMLGRKHPSLMYDCAKPAVEELSGHYDLIPGWRLDALHRLCKKNSGPHQRQFKQWLQQIDYTLEDVRGFSPTIKIKFGENEGVYDRDWVESRLVSPDHYDTANDVCIYKGVRDDYLRKKPKPISFSVYAPFGGTITAEGRKFADIVGKYINWLKGQERRYGREPGFQEGLKFIQLTWLLARDKAMDSSDSCDVI